MSFYDDLSKSDIEIYKLPLEEILHDSLYYPACGFDGRIIKYCNKYATHLNIRNFVYCDSGVMENDFNRQINNFEGYLLFSQKRLTTEDLGMDVRNMPFENNSHFIHWVVYQRTDDKDETHGPKRFSLLFINAEGAFIYKKLYCATGVLPKVFVVTQHGWDQGCNDFCNPQGLLHSAMESHPLRKPEKIFYNKHQLNWNDYHREKRWNWFTIWNLNNGEGY